MDRPPPLPGGIGVSKLTVYSWQAPDGLVGGSAHVHLACTEGYFVVGGTGRVQTLTAKGFDETPLHPGAVAWFTPGTIHRLVNDSGDLEIVCLMQNAGLPEAGDAVLTFPPEVLADRERYTAAVDVAGSAGPPLERARERRDLAITGFLALRERVEREGPGALHDFYQAAVEITRDRVAVWRELWRDSALRAVGDTERWLDALETGQAEHLTEASLQRFAEPEAIGVPGMCGTLETYPPPEW